MTNKDKHTKMMQENINMQTADLTSQAKQRRRLLTTGAIAGLAPVWGKPLINSIVLPAHAQTSMCVTDMTVGGPLTGNAFGATSCQAACEAEAASLNAQLCAVEENQTPSGVDCSCDLDLP